jgi:hypothetical protein
MSGALGDGGGFDFDALAQERKREREGIRRPLAQTADVPPPALDPEPPQIPTDAPRADELGGEQPWNVFDGHDTTGQVEYWRRSFSDVPLNEWTEEEWNRFQQSPEAEYAAAAEKEELNRRAFSKVPTDKWTTEDWQRYNQAYPEGHPQLFQPRTDEWHRQIFSKIPLDEWTEEEWDRYRHSNHFQIADIDHFRLFSRDVLGHDPERHQDDWTSEEYERYLTFQKEKETEEGPLTQEQAEEEGWVEDRYSDRNDREKEIGADALKRERKKALDIMGKILHIERGGMSQYSEEDLEQAEEYLEMFQPGGVFDNDDGWYDGPPTFYDENPHLRSFPGDRGWAPSREI